MICDKKRELYLTRIELFMKRISQMHLGESVELEATFGHSVEPTPFDRRLDLTFKSIKEGGKWGEAWESAWFRLEGTVPKEWAGKKVVAHLDFNSEALVFGEDGTPLQGLTNSTVYVMNWTRDIFPLFDCADGGEDIALWVEAAANPMTGVKNTDEEAPRGSPHRYGSYTGRINKIRLAIFDQELKQLYNDFFVLYYLYTALPEKSTRAVRILRGLTDAIDAFADDSANAAQCRKILRPLLEQKATASSVTVTAVGHAHIDTGWLWPVREAKRKCARSWSNQISNMERYPGYVFGASQPAHYAMVKEHYPQLYAKIKEAVKDGRWEPQGAMWVEADCNLISGESMVRQFIHGKNFFKDEFGCDIRNLWLPDVFGYSAAMPQIMKRAGVNYFLTQKISWSQFNEFPYTTFMWRGIDGSSVLTHFPPENTYNSWLTPSGLVKAEENFREREVLDEMIVLFGMGDGGGGPKDSHIERGLRQRDLEGVPKVRLGRADDFFERLSKHMADLPVWSGELYLERHRGTLTSQARTKRGNRRLELALRETEYLLSCANMETYPAKELDAIWKTMLTNQFHDILPGSSIRKVYEVTEKEYADGLAVCHRIQQETAEKLFPKDDKSLVLVNTLNIPFTQAIALPENWGGAKDVLTQRETDGTVTAIVEIPPQGMISLVRDDGASRLTEANDLILENDMVSYEFDANGQLIRAFDKEAEKDFLAGPGNVLTLYEDRPNANDAWDIDIFYENQAMETARAAGHTSLGKGDVRQGLQFELKVGQSTLTQKVYLDANSKRLDFRTTADWQECHRMLRVAFPTTIRSDLASFDIQYGYTNRNTHRNLSWDMARFEVAAHKYADLSDNDYGVALLNDCKYGYKILENVIDLNLLRSPTHPDPDCDLDHHEFTYSILPHTGDLIHSNVQEQAIQLNQPPIIFSGHKVASASVPVTAEGIGVSLEVIKKAEKEDCLVIRLVERLGRETTAKLTLAETGAELIETDLMEWNDLDSLGTRTIEIPMKAFEIRTFKILPSA